MDIQIPKGAGAKIRLEIAATGFNMHDNEFYVVLKQGGFTRTIPKSAFKEDEQQNFYLCIDTVQWKIGIVDAYVWADVPDMDFPNHIRKEVDKFRIIIID